MTAFMPAALWPVRWSCDVSTASPTITGAAVQFASNTLWALTGRQFGLTTVALRPCVRGYVDTPFPDAWLSWPGTQRPPLGANGSGGWYGFWFVMGCGSCSDGGCGCSALTEVKLPAPVYDVVTVLVDGAPLVSGTGYRVDDNRILRRVDGFTWPRTNNLNLSDSQVGTWSVTARYGTPVPGGAELAVGELACEYVRAVSGDDCRLPRNVTQLARQGVTIAMPDPLTLFDQGLTGLPMADLFIHTWNPGKLRARARTYSVDHVTARRAGT